MRTRHSLTREDESVDQREAQKTHSSLNYGINRGQYLQETEFDSCLDYYLINNLDYYHYLTKDWVKRSAWTALHNRINQMKQSWIVFA